MRPGVSLSSGRTRPSSPRRRRGRAPAKDRPAGAVSRRFTTSSGAQISNNKQHRCATPAATGGEKERFASTVALLDTKKEELYNLLAEIERNRKYRVSSMLGRHQNRVLLQHLSVQVDVKPDDTEWRRFRRSHLTVVGTRLALAWLAGLYLAEITRNHGQRDDPSRGELEKDVVSK